MHAWRDYLPNLKDALTGFYEEQLKNTVESKTGEFKSLLEKNLIAGQNTQKALIAIILAIFLLLAIAYFWKDEQKYLLLGILTSYLVSYLYYLSQSTKKL